MNDPNDIAGDLPLYRQVYLHLKEKIGERVADWHSLVA